MDLDVHTLKAAQQTSTSSMGAPTHKNVSWVHLPCVAVLQMLPWLGGGMGGCNSWVIFSSPWREVATGNCLLSAGTEGCGCQLLRAVEDRNVHALQHCSACTHTHHALLHCSVLQPPLDTRSSLCWTLWLSSTAEHSTEVAGHSLSAWYSQNRGVAAGFCSVNKSESLGL